jgi:hypothetical protein
MDCTIIIKDKKMKNTIKIFKMMNKTVVWVVVMMLSVTSAFATDPIEDIPATPEDNMPIDDYVWVMALIGLCYVYFRIRAISKQTTTNVE